MLRFFQFAAQFVVLGLAIAFVVVYLRPDLLPALDPPAATEAAHSYAEVVNASAPAVVSIYTRTLVTEPMFRNLTNPLYRALYGNRTVTLQRPGLGSGVIVSADGFVLTTRHVISEADNILVALYDGRTAEAVVIGSDPETDLAVLKIDLDDLPVAELTEQGRPRTGDIVLAIGNAFGLSHTVTLGIVSATGRGQLNLTTFEDFIQTDAAINAGNSGGALVNTTGKVVGINTAALHSSAGAQGIGFAIPAPLAREIMDQIIEYGQVRRGWIGTELTDVALAMRIGQRNLTGARIVRAESTGPAWQAGLRPGDIIVNVDGEDIDNARELNLLIAQTPAGVRLEVEVVRGNQLFTTSVEVIQQPPPASN